MVARMHGVHEVAGSSPVTQTIKKPVVPNDYRLFVTLLFLEKIGTVNEEYL